MIHKQTTITRALAGLAMGKPVPDDTARIRASLARVAKAMDDAEIPREAWPKARTVEQIRADMQAMAEDPRMNFTAES